VAVGSGWWVRVWVMKQTDRQAGRQAAIRFDRFQIFEQANPNTTTDRPASRAMKKFVSSNSGCRYMTMRHDQRLVGDGDDDVIVVEYTEGV